MKRSQINKAIEHAVNMLEKERLKLPQFAYWSVDEWKKRTNELGNIQKIMLGWDVTDFGLGDFEKKGAVLFTIRNGHWQDENAGTPYAEKLIFLKDEHPQEITYHFHRAKTEDIINRGGGILELQLYHSHPDDSLDDESDIHVKMDGFIRKFPAGSIIEIEKGGSITLQPGLYHRFCPKKGCGDLIIGEVSSINDDTKDNIFLNPSDRFVDIIEDEPTAYLLCNEYQKLA